MSIKDDQSKPIILNGTRIQKSFYNILKKVLDLFGSLIALFLTAPLWIVIAFLIKIDSNGSVFFKQQRVGKKGKLFTLLKFRTMYREVDRYTESPKDLNDARLTKIGKILRPCGLDEIPQLLNIIKGDMSLVGPRPEMPFIVESYKPYERVRLAVKPGLTGLWQILGPKGQSIHKNIEYDLYYLKKSSPRLDLWIILWTIPSILSGENIRRHKSVCSILEDILRINYFQIT